MAEWQKELERIKEGIKEIHNDAVAIVLTNYEGEFKQRVFNDGGSKNADNANLGLYKSAYYSKRRVALGRSGNPINLSFSGELERSIKMVNIDDDIALVVTPVNYVNSRYYKNPSANTDEVSTYIDNHFGETFEPTKEEVESNNKLLDTTIEEKFNELIK
jgi:hypothetical protein